MLFSSSCRRLRFHFLLWPLLKYNTVKLWMQIINPPQENNSEVLRQPAVINLLIAVQCFILKVPPKYDMINLKRFLPPGERWRQCCRDFWLDSWDEFFPLSLLRYFFCNDKVVYLLWITHDKTWINMCMVWKCGHREIDGSHVGVGVPSLPPVGNTS